MKQKKIKKIFILLTSILLLLLTTFNYTSANWTKVINAINEAISIKGMIYTKSDLPMLDIGKSRFEQPELFTCIPNNISAITTPEKKLYIDEDIKIYFEPLFDLESKYCKQTPKTILDNIKTGSLVIKNNSNRTINLIFSPEDPAFKEKLMNNGLDSIFRNWTYVKKRQHINENGFIFERWNELGNIKPGQKIKLIYNDRMFQINQKVEDIYIKTDYKNTITDSVFSVPIFKFSLINKIKKITAIDYDRKNLFECEEWRRFYWEERKDKTSYVKYGYELEGYNENAKLKFLWKSCVFE